MTCASIVGFLFMAGGLVGLVVTKALFSSAPVVIASQVTALALMVWARLTLGRRSFHPAAGVTEGELVTSGPYHFIRHPIYTAACLFCLAGVSANFALLPLGYGALLLVGVLIRILAEERMLVDRYPAYRNYAKGTKRMFPYLF
jgi:protein-S-isoprenylcysteine O-methyltransferase Ste14